VEVREMETNTEEIDEKKYPVLTDELYKNPHGGIVICRRTDIPTDHSIPPAWGVLNEAGAKLLSECNGEKTIGDIIAQVYGEESDKARDPLVEYFKNASLTLNMEFCDSPSPHEVKSCGTVECYYPLRVVGEVTTRCNLTCQHCYISAGSDGVDMKREDLFRIVSKLSEEGTLNFDISGGEPFVRKDIFDIVEKCCNTFYDVTISTNGTLIGKEEAKRLSEYSNLQIHVSLDSHTSQFHDKFRQVEGTFDKAVSAICNLVSEGVYTRIGTSILKDNVNRFKKIVHLAEELGVSGMNFDMARPTGRGEVLDMKPKKVMSWMKKMWKIVKEYEDEAFLVYERSRREFTARNCGAGTTMWTIGPTGHVRPCATLSEDYLVCGNLFREDFHSVFSGDRAKKFSEMESPCKEVCGKCTYIYHCNKCFCNGVLMYKTLKDKCRWGVKMKISDWVTLT
jgi:MoaA/NifB/PqqE/SkfB family radical SAM enzyme